MHTALEAVEYAFDAVFVAIAQHGLLQRQPRLSRIGDKGLPAEPVSELGDCICLAGEAGDVVARVLNHPPATGLRAPGPGPVFGVLPLLLFPRNAEQTLSARV